jgi:aminopeptidase-like protein
MKNLIKFGKKIFPICRSITGNGTLLTLREIKKNYLKNLKIKKIPSRKKVFDWRIPDEWNIKYAYVIDKNSKKIIDFKINNLHVINYSEPQNKIINKKQLLAKLNFINDYPDAIPYVTSYYKKNWGFCVTKNQYDKIKKNYKDSDKFRVKISSSFKKNGNLHYGELLIPGKSKKEILLSTYVCHPSMANNELSGPLLSIALVKYFKNKKKLAKSLRFIFIPETIGSISYINTNFSKIKNILFGFILTCVGDNKKFSMLTTKYNDTIIDKLCSDAYKKLGFKVKKYSFLERGSDERQFSSPGVDLPMISMMRSKYNTYKEYHTSKDNFDFMNAEGLKKSFKIHKYVLNKLLKMNEKKIYLGKIKSYVPKKNNPISIKTCEPNLGKRGLYHLVGTPTNQTLETSVANILDFLQYSDGSNQIKQIGKYINLNFKKTNELYYFLKKKNLVK